MPKTSSNIISTFLSLEKKAVKEAFTAKKKIEKAIAKDIAAVHKKYAPQIKGIDSLLSRFGGSSSAPKAKAVKSEGKRTRRQLPKVNDDQIKDAVSKIAAGGKKVTSAQIFRAANITRPRFNSFLKANQGFLKVEGNKRSTVYFL
jgi:hypothetical protein